MSKNKELIEKYEQIRKLQEKRERQERHARDQAEELEDILAVSRRAHEEAGEVPLAPSSRLSGPATRTRAPGASVNPEDAYSQNLKAARFASPEAFSRNKAPPPVVLDPMGSVSKSKHREPPPMSAEEKRRQETARLEQARLEAARAEAAKLEQARAEAARVEASKLAAQKATHEAVTMPVATIPRRAGPEETRTMAGRQPDPVDYETTQVIRPRVRPTDARPEPPAETAPPKSPKRRRRPLPDATDPDQTGVVDVEATDPDRTGFALAPQQESTDPDNTGVVAALPDDPGLPRATPPPPPDKRKDLDELISKFAANVEVRMGEGRENTFLRKRSELLRKEATQTMAAPKPKPKKK